MRAAASGTGVAVRRVVASFVALAASVVPCAWPDGGARAAGLDALLLTPSERAARTLESDGRRRLIDEAPGSEWAAHARYREGEIDAALAGFESRLADETDADERHRLRYNRATALVRAGRPDEAIEAFDELLEERPGDGDAATNRDVARRLAELQRSRQRAGERDGAEGGEGESDADADGAERPDAGADERSEERPGEGAGAAGDAPTDEDSPGEAPGGDGAAPGEPSGADGASEASEVLDAGDERRAAGAESDAGAAPGGIAGEEFGDEGATERGDGPPAAAPLGEREQAVEQWLRRIPDDPSGLLRRKLLQSHRRDWPDVVEGGGGL